jgi:UDP-glucose 4-epimerase
MKAPGLTVAVTGPTGDIGRELLRALERDAGVERVVGLARRPFDPSTLGLEKTEYVQGDVLDRSAVDALIKDADVVIHLAFLILGSEEKTRAVNLDGCRNVFEAALQAPVKRLVYTSSVAAYGFYEDHPDLLTEDIPARGSDEHGYSKQKAEVERLLAELTNAYPETDVFVFRPCIVAGPDALSLIEEIPYVKLTAKLPARVKQMLGGLPLLRPVIPDPGLPFQLVHAEDLARALMCAVRADGPPGIYNVAADGEIGLADLAHACGWYAIPVPELTLDAAISIVSRFPYLPPSATWVNALKVPVLMDCSKAKEQLEWEPHYDALETLAETIHSARQRGLLAWRQKNA